MNQAFLFRLAWIRSDVGLVVCEIGSSAFSVDGTGTNVNREVDVGSAK